MTTQSWLLTFTGALFVLIAVAERIWPARSFPEIRGWYVLGIVFFFYTGFMNFIILSFLPSDWLRAHRLFDFSRLGIGWSVAAGQLCITLVMYVWHRATHETGFLWRGFHQLHHAPRRMNVYVSSFHHPFDLGVYVAMPNVIALFVLGVEPLAAAILGNLAAANAFLQHANLRTPRWLALFAQRPEAHCVHHQRGLHRFNYSDLPLWDFLFGTFRNPARWQGETGFDPPADQMYLSMLIFVDVNKSALGDRSFGQVNEQD